MWEEPPLEPEFPADGAHDVVDGADGFRQIDEAHAVKIASRNMLLAFGERGAGDDKMLAPAEDMGDGGVQGARVAAPGVWPAETDGKRPGGGRRPGVVRAHQDDHHIGSIFQNAIPIFSRTLGRTAGTVL